MRNINNANNYIVKRVFLLSDRLFMMCLLWAGDYSGLYLCLCSRKGLQPGAGFPAAAGASSKHHGASCRVPGCHPPCLAVPHGQISLPFCLSAFLPFLFLSLK